MPSPRFIRGGSALGVRVHGWGNLFTIVGVARDTKTFRVDEPPTPYFYVPVRQVYRPEYGYTFVVRTASANPLALASTLRGEVPRARSGFRVSNIRTQAEINQSALIRERLLATLALFFSVVVAPVLASVLFRKRLRDWENPLLGLLTRAYRRSVTWTVHHRWVMVSVAAIAPGSACATTRTLIGRKHT